MAAIERREQILSEATEEKRQLDEVWFVHCTAYCSSTVSQIFLVVYFFARQ